ncbi:[acyl-]glycerolphosphate acyltransferase and acyl-(acyl carrier protein) ligase, major facilitator superfamily domain-containing [Syntrophotalea carbinolica DSM 2380]|uniref:[acyl-]glycerolphosphate acyltransferase and acyl-(Acyl carrier protein) ligase, major facilitator superfamily domain-containing n=1 Tax=Syntrophotalea carbinolica (strain DSM 2380 / NBRC 103641 / GraBd1) TaxID=338963 RepID=Q3A0U6_SYNC1|nr:acyl-[ACP]--phospholipid O-acyltransferase [Syntrophotalea carbinolica]ABA90011.1 [acyl-]glycerolphosphate acyltransferase and acyl-(acyl carrier protein) ligase, major facilitator superfamily domain-containing [Syntrophotalea carbinolica DSM 2380]
MPTTEQTSPLAGAFHRLNAAQALGALNDNLIKLIIVFALISRQGADQAGTIAALGSAAFIAPFLLFSALAGSLADHFPKNRIIVWIKGFEIGIALLAVIGTWTGNPALLYLTVFLLGCHSAILAPAKYGIVPEFAAREELSRANSLLETFTFMAIVGGTALAPFLVQFFGGRHHISLLIALGLGLAGWLLARSLPTTAAAAGNRTLTLSPMAYWRTLCRLRHDHYLLLAIIGAAYFLFVGAFCQLNLLPYGIIRLGLTEEQSGYLFLAAALGIGVGSLLAGRLSGRNVEFGVVPIGAAGLTLAAFDLHVIPAHLPLVLTVIVLFGISAGLFIVPLQAFIQMRAPADRRGEILAASSFLSWMGALAASGLLWLISGPMGIGPDAAFSLLGAITLLLTILTLYLLPDFLLRFIALVVMRVGYRLTITGRQHIPVEGGALLVANHVSWVDALLLTATQQRRIRFVMDRGIYQTPLLRQLFRLMRVIPVSAKDGRKGLKEFIGGARKALDDGYMVCIFAEGEITRNGMLNEFKGGFERIVKGTDYPIIPVYIGGAWGSILSYAHGKLLSRFPSRLPYPVTVAFGEPLPAGSSAHAVRSAVMELSCDWFNARKPERRSLGEMFVDTARQNWRRPALADTGGRRLSYGQALTAARILAQKLSRLTGDSPMVGVCLPPTVGGALANLALNLNGTVPVNLNYTASDDAIRSAIARCQITCTISSRVFMEKLGTLPELPGTVYIEDLLAGIGSIRKMRAFLIARLLPSRFWARPQNFDADQLATVIFSSGSTGEPKGVMLSHHNILSNLEALRIVFRVDKRDNICSALPFFHSLGFTGTLWLPLLSGFSAVYHTNPLDGATIARTVREHRSTLLLTTPTFLMAYIRRAKPADFASLRLVMTGAEKLKTKLADSFEQRFGIRPLEGYGATELSPVISLSVPDVEIDGIRQSGSREGSVGLPVPGVAVQIVDLDNYVPVDGKSPGLILVKGPNLMLGYLGRPDKTAAAIRDGWYVTGDIGHLDRSGFLHITDRMARFSKIGGEMIPHGAVEDALHTALGRTGVLAVTGIPDDKRGEKLVVVHTPEAGEGAALHDLLTQIELPNLWKPGRDCYVQVEAMPLLGTGKLDLRGIRKIAMTGLA